MSISSLQKAGTWQRVSAYLFDMILTVMIIVGAAAALSAILGYNDYSKQLEDYTNQYAQEYGIELDITQEEYDALSDEDKELYQQANKAFGKDAAIQELYEKMFSTAVSIASLSTLSTYLILYFAIPLIFGNGQTLGKKIFNLAVVRTNCVKISGPVLFTRSILGQCVIETMVPILLVFMLLFGVIGGAGPLVILLLLVLQVVMIAITPTHSAIHDLLADTAVVEYSSQMIFASEEELIAYKKAEHEKLVSQNHDFGRLDGQIPAEPMTQSEQE